MRLVSAAACVAAWLGVIGGFGATAAAAGPKAGEGPYLAMTMASRHVNAGRDYNEFNPGTGIGYQAVSAGLRWTVEGGGYRNSHNETSAYAMAGIDRQVAAIGPVEVRMGVTLGAALYPGRGDGFRSRGVPAVGDWVPVAGGTLSVLDRQGRELHLCAIPAGAIAEAVVTLQWRNRF